MSESRFHYTISQKLQIIDQIEENKDSTGSQQEHPVTQRQIRNWSQQREAFQSLSPMKQRTTRILHTGPKLKYAELFTFLYAKLKSMREEGLAINHNMLIRFACEEEPRIQELTHNGKCSLIDRFMKTFNLTLRTITSTNLLLPRSRQSSTARDY